MIAVRSSVERVQVSLLVLTIAFLLVALQCWCMKVDVAALGDSAWYWQDSLQWRTPFNPYHVPGFALTIALLRGASFGLLPPAVVMMSITWAALLAGAWAVYRSVELSGASKGLPTLAAYLYGLWPCVGILAAVFPDADTPALALLLLGLLALQSARPRTAAVLFGLALVFHKFNLLFVGLILLADILGGRGKRWRDAMSIAALLLPITAIWMLGWCYHHSPLWMLSTSLNVGAETRKSWPIFGGIVAAVSAGGAKSILKGGIVVGFTALAATLLLLTIRKKGLNWQYGLAISAGCLFFFVFLTEAEIWAAVRVSRLLVLPLVWNMSGARTRRFSVRMATNTAWLMALLLSQFFFAWYAGSVFPSSKGKAHAVHAAISRTG